MKSDEEQSVAGEWAGVLNTGRGSLRLWLSVAGSTRELSAKLFSLDQGAIAITCRDVSLDGEQLSFEVPDVGGSYRGTLSADRKSLSGTWQQRGSLPLDLTRQAPGSRPVPAPAVTPRPARPPIPLDELKPVLDGEFEPVLDRGVLSQSTGGGVVIGMLERGQRRIFCYGAARPDSIFEIGSVTKTFTGLLLAQLVEQKKVSLDEPVRGLLPPGTVAKPDGPEITLLDLATQHSGLPRLPDNLYPLKDPSDPYAHYHAPELYAFLARHGVVRPNLTFAVRGWRRANLITASI